MSLAPTTALQGLPSLNEIWSWHQLLAGMGTRYTGSNGHAKFTQWLHDQFLTVPDFQLHIERITFHRWLAENWSLRIDQNATAGPSGQVPVSYYYPYSGKTDPNGVTGRLIDLGPYTPFSYTRAFWQRAAGEIALVRVPASMLSLDIGAVPTGGFEHGKSLIQTLAQYESDASLVTNPVFQGILAAVPLLHAKEANVRGVICVWTGMSDDQVANQYNPITTRYPNKQGLPVPNDPGCPALWVGDSTGSFLARSASIGDAKVTLILTASITPGATTDTIWGVLPGSGADHERGLIINSHTDGPSVPEENGALGMLALAQYFAQRERNRDLIFAMVSGHFQLPQFIQDIPNGRFVIGNDATSLWMAQTPAIYQNALAGLTMEHLGCTMWADDAGGQYAPTGNYDWSATYTTQRRGSANVSNVEQQAYLNALHATDSAGTNVGRTVTALPEPLFFGEGAPLYAGGLGTVSLCSIPSYLLQAGSRTHPELLNLDKLNPQLVYGQIQTFARTISMLDAAPASAF